MSTHVSLAVISDSSSSSSSSTSTSDSSSSSATSPRPVAQIGEVMGTSGKARLPPEDVNPEVALDVRNARTLTPWAFITCSLKVIPSELHSRFHIPPSFEIIIPQSHERLHTPPEGCRSFYLSMLEGGLRFPIPEPVGQILNGLDLCPAQLAPNGIRHIIVFIIVMKYLELDPSFENFWSLYQLVSSKKTDERGFYYLTARTHCKFVTDLPSNLGNWREKFLYVRAPREHPWPFRGDWRHSKPAPVVYDDGLDDDLINSLTIYWYKANKLIKEEVLKLADLTPADVPVRSTLGDSSTPSAFKKTQRELTNYTCLVQET